MHRHTLATISTAVFSAFLVLGCEPRDEVPGDDTAAATARESAGDVATAAGAIRVADIIDNPGRFAGDTVTVEADVEEVLGTWAFALDEDAPLAGGIDNDLLVFSPKSAQLSDIDDQWLNNTVRVTGTVHQMTVAELEQRLERDLDPNLESKLEGSRPVLIAHTIERVGQR